MGATERKETTQLKTRGIKPTDTKNTGDLWVLGYGFVIWHLQGSSFSSECRRGLSGCTARSVSIRSSIAARRSVPAWCSASIAAACAAASPLRMAGSARTETVAYLRAREQVTTVYLETVRRIELERAQRQVRALCFIVDRSHVQYAGRLTLAECVHHVRQGHGRSGADRDYVVETVRMEALGCGGSRPASRRRAAQIGCRASESRSGKSEAGNQGRESGIGNL